jgi:hypothetical protein
MQIYLDLRAAMLWGCVTECDLLAIETLKNAKKMNWFDLSSMQGVELIKLGVLLDAQLDCNRCY